MPWRSCRMLLAVAAVSLALGATARAAEMLVGFATPLTGPYAATGNRHRTAAEAAIQDLNGAGGVLGRPVRLVTVDDACGTDQAEAAARQLVESGVRFVVGHLCSHSSLLAAAVYEAADVVMMTTTASHPRLTEEGRGNVFRLIGRDDRQGTVAGDFLADAWSDRRIAFLRDGSPYGNGLVERARRRLRERGLTEVLELPYVPGAEDSQAIAERLRQARVDVAYIGGYGPEAARILRAARERGDDLQLVGGHALGMDEFWSIAGRAGNGTIFSGRRDTGLTVGSGPLPAGMAASEPGRRPSSLATYAAVQVWAQAAERAGSADSASLARTLRRGRFGTVLGPVAFDGKGDLAGGDWQWQVWVDGRHELLKPAFLANAR